MRSAPTLSEAKLWAELAGSKLGVAFRRQAVVGDAIVDFLAPSRRLIVEVDGVHHTRRRRADVRRDARLRTAGYRVVRIDVELVVRDLAAAVARVVEALV
jgi:very-short-patch-repair endonuclease